MQKYISFNKTVNVNENILMTLDNTYEKEVFAPDGQKLSLICIIPIEKIKEILKHKNFLLNTEILSKYIYIFSYYNEDGYFLDSITCNGTEEEFESIKSGYTKVVIEDENYANVSLDNSYEMVLNDFPIEASWFGDEPEFLQNEDYYFLKDYVFLAQINGLDLPSDLNELFYLSDAIGYIFIKKDLKEGVFFVQNT